MENIIYKQFKEINGRIVVGIDESGRGPVLGYLVYGAVISKSEDVKNMKFRDSKKTSKNLREQQFKTIKSELSFIYKALHPQHLTENMLYKSKNLNELSFETVFHILDEISSFYEISEVFIDTIGDPKKYANLLKQRYKCKFIVEVKADARYKIVSAASILAKVIRDDLINKMGIDCGTGYPGDPKTREWLSKNLNPIFGYPNIVRFSWLTIDDFLPKKKSKKMKGDFEGFYFSEN